MYIYGHGYTLKLLVGLGQFSLACLNNLVVGSVNITDHGDVVFRVELGDQLLDQTTRLLQGHHIMLDGAAHCGAKQQLF